MLDLRKNHRETPESGVTTTPIYVFCDPSSDSEWAGVCDFDEIAHGSIERASRRNGKTIFRLTESAAELLESLYWEKQADAELEKVIDSAVLHNKTGVLKSADFGFLFQ